MARKRSDDPAYQVAKPGKPKRCIAYARCSVKKKKEDTDDPSDSITAQVDSLARIVKRFGLDWDQQLYSDDGVPGWQRRDGLENLIEAVGKQHGANCLAIRSLNRLTRLPPLDSANLLAKLRGLGIVALYTEDAGEIVLPEPDEAWGWARIVMDSGMCHSQSRTTSYNVAQAMVSQLQRSVADAAKQPPWSESKQPRRLKVTSRPPYGYRDVKFGTNPGVFFERHLDPDLAPIAKRIFQAFLDGKSSCAIAATLNKEGLRTRRGKLFSNDTIEGLLVNRAYLGEFVRFKKSYGTFHHTLASGVQKIPDAAKKGRRNSKPAAVDNDPDEQLVLTDCWEPLLTPAQFAKIQTKISNRVKKGTKARKTSGALSCGVSRCGHCGQRLRLARFARGASYFCVTPESGVGGCDYGGHVREDVLLPQLMGELTKALGKETQRLETCLATPTAAPQPTDALDRRIAQLTTELDASNATLVRLMKRTPAPETAIDMAANAIERLSAELAKLKADRQTMVKLPADQESQVRERLDWLRKHAVAIRRITLIGGKTSETVFEDPKNPIVGMNENFECILPVPTVPGSYRYDTATLHYDAERVRNLCQELGLTVSVTWEGKRGDSHRGYVRSATASFSANCFPVASKVRQRR